MEIGKTEKEFMEALYTLHKVNSEVSSRVNFLKNYTGFTQVPGDTLEQQLNGLELAFISDEIYLAK